MVKEKLLGELLHANDLVGVQTDLILEWYGRPYRITKVGTNENGLIVHWHYKDFKLRIERVIGEEPVHHKTVSVYAVTKVYVKKKIEENHVKTKRKYRHH